MVAIFGHIRTYTGRATKMVVVLVLMNEEINLFC